MPEAHLEGPPVDHHHAFGLPDERGSRKCISSPYCMMRIHSNSVAMDLWIQVEQLRFTVGALLTVVDRDGAIVLPTLTGNEAFRRGVLIGASVRVMKGEAPAADA